MRSQFVPIFLLLVFSFFLVSNSSNPPDGRTGAPGETNCTSCHGGNNSNNFEGSLLIEGLPEQITPNATYTISVISTKTGGNPTRTGFQLVALDEANQNVGILANPSASSTLKNSNQRTYFEHNPAIDFQQENQVSWTVDWAAPATIDTEVTFYANSILGDGAGSRGDLMLTAGASGTIIQGEPAVLSVAKTSQNVSCFEGADGFASLEISGGQAPYSYQWSNGDTGATTMMLTAGEYTVTIMDSVGDSMEETVTITQPEALTIELLSQSNIDCINAIGLAEVLATGGTPEYNYVWEDIEGPAVSLTTGEHTVTVTDANGCSQTRTVIIEGDTELPQVNAGPAQAIDCNNPFAVLEGSGDVGPDFTYFWSTSDGSILAEETSLTPLVEAAGIYTLLVTNTSNNCSASAQVDVKTDFEEPIANAGTTKQLSCEEDAVTLDGSSSSTGDNITYQWTTENGILRNPTAIRASASQQGLYTLTVSNTSNGCSSTATVNVIQDVNMPTAVAGNPQQLDCTTGTAILNGNGSVGVDFIYSWETEDGIIESGENTLTPVVIAPGTYQLTVRNRTNNCDASSSVVITEGVQLIANAGADEDLGCSTESVRTLNGSQSSRGSNIIYEWTTTDGNIINDPTAPLINIDAPGTYTLTVRDTLANCTVTDMVLISQKDKTPEIEVVPTLEITCEMPVIMLQVDAIESPAFSFQWSTTDGNIVDGRRTISPIVDAPGTYNLGVINTETGCVATASVLVTQEDGMPIARINTSTQELDCTNPSLTLDASSSSIGDDFLVEWTTESGNIVEGANTLTPTINTEGTYSLLITNTSSGCTTTTSIDIFQTSTPPSIVTEEPPLLDCANTSIQLIANATGNNLVYEWSTEEGAILSGGNTLTPIVAEAGAYTLIIIDTVSACKSMTQINVAKEESTLSVQIESPQALSCINASITLNTIVNEDENLTYLWCTETGNIIEGVEGPNPVIDQAGTYDVLVTDNVNGCTGSAMVVVEEIPALHIITDTVINNTATVLAGGGSRPYTYLWNTEPAQTSVTANNLVDGEYQVTITDAIGCSITTSVVVGTVSVPHISSLTSLDLYPNPTSTFFTVSANFNKKELGNIHIFNNLGEKIWTRGFDTHQIQLAIETNNWNAGVYFMMLETVEGIKVEEIAVLK